MSRTLVLLLALAPLAGCVDTLAEPAPVPESAAAALPYHGEGTVWLPPTRGNAREETLLPFPVNASGMAASAELVLGMRMLPVADAPPVLADVLVELRAPDGSVLAEARLGADETEASLFAEGLAQGEHVLALLSYGGSDGAAYGQYVRYVLDAA